MSATIIRVPYPAAAGGGTPAFPSIASIWAWWEVDRQGLSNGANIAQWDDQSGNGRHMTALSLSDPTVETGALNGLAVVRAPSTGRGFTLPNMTALTASHVFMVLKADNDPPLSSSGNENMLHGNCVDNYCVVPWTDNNVYEGWGSANRKNCGNFGPSMAAWHVYEIISISGEFTVRMDGVQMFTTASNTPGFPTPPRGIFKNHGTGQWWTGRCFGIYQCSAKITGTDRTNLINYINTRTGLSSA